MSNTTEDIIIIGAGISGLLAAQQLQQDGKRVLVLEKSRGLGGRLATRRMDGAVLDHGAQYFTARHPEYRKLTDLWVGKNWLQSWFQRPTDSNGAEDRYIGTQGMTTVPKAIAENVKVVRKAMVNSVFRDQGVWHCQMADGTQPKGKILISTAPIPQSLDVLHAGKMNLPPADTERFASVDYERSLALLVVLKKPSQVPAPGYLRPEEGPISWIADNQAKGISSVPALTLHSTPEFALRYWDEPDALRLPLLLHGAKQWIRSGILATHLHRWRYARPLQPLGTPYYWNESLQLGLAGDAFLGGRVESAALSGWKLARKILSRA